MGKFESGIKRHLTRLGALEKETNSITQIGDDNEYSK